MRESRSLHSIACFRFPLAKAAGSIAPIARGSAPEHARGARLAWALAEYQVVTGPLLTGALLLALAVHGSRANSSTGEGGAIWTRGEACSIEFTFRPGKRASRCQQRAADRWAACLKTVLLVTDQPNSRVPVALCPAGVGQQFPHFREIVFDIKNKNREKRDAS